MSDRNRPHANGRSDPAGLPAGKLAAWWDRRSVERRTGSSDTPSERPVAVVAQLEALARADDLSAPRPGFLDGLERQIMQTSPKALTAPIASPHTHPAPVIRPGQRPRQRPRQGRGLIDVLSVAAVLALLLGGSWSVLNDRADAPTPNGYNGVVGVSTPDPFGLEPLVREVTLTQPWAEPVGDSPLDGLVPIPVTDCTTPSRSSDWFSTVSDPGATPLPIESDAPSSSVAGSVSPEEMAEYPSASSEDRESVEAFFHQLVACRNAVEPGNDPGRFLQEGPFWNLLSTDFLLQMAGQIDQQEYDVQAFDLLSQTVAALGLQVFPAEILDVRELADDSLGRRQLLVEHEWVGGTSAERMSVLVMEDGLWRVGSSNVVQYAADADEREAGVASILNSHWSAGVEAGSTQFITGMPLSITVTNTAYTNLTVTIGGQNVGNLTYGETLYTTPFSVSSATVQAAGGAFTISVAVLGLGALLTEPYQLTVGYSPPDAQTRPATPEDSSTPGATPAAQSAIPNVVKFDQL